MPPSDDETINEAIDCALAKAVIAAKVANAEAKGHYLTAQAFFEKSIWLHQQLDDALSVVAEQARELCKLKREAVGLAAKIAEAVAAERERIARQIQSMRDKRYSSNAGWALDDAIIAIRRGTP